MKNQNFILLVGPSGSGKSSIARMLCSLNNWTSIDSYTTRKPREDDEKGHIFVSDDEMNKIVQNESLVAIDTYNGNRYCATENQVEQNDIYIINPKGVIDFMQRYHGNKTIKLIYLNVEPVERIKRMADRGDNIENIVNRIKYDRQEFSEENIEKIFNLFSESDAIRINNVNIWKTMASICRFC